MSNNSDGQYENTYAEGQYTNGGGTYRNWDRDQGYDNQGYDNQGNQGYERRPRGANRQAQGGYRPRSTNYRGRG